MLDNLTEELVKRVIKKCPDQVIGILSFDTTINEWIIYEYNNFILKEKRKENKRRIKIRKKFNNGRIIIILESPHVDEFEKKFIGPALGETGKQIDDKFVSKFNNFLQANKTNVNLKYKKYEIILMNSIQYETSLGCVTNIYRDRVWLTLWSNKSIRRSFRRRIKKYEANIIINLCTNGSNEYEPIIPEKKLINFRFIDAINLGMKQDIYGNLKLTDNIIFDRKYTSGSSLSGKKYKLKYFTQTLLDSLKLNTINIEDNHPSCWGRIDSNFKLL